MRKLTVIALALIMTVSTGAAALAEDSNGEDTQAVIRGYELDGTATNETIGWSKLIRRDDGLKATASVSDLIPGGVYTFWWVVIQEGGFPADAFVASAGG